MNEDEQQREVMSLRLGAPRRTLIRRVALGLLVGTVLLLGAAGTAVAISSDALSAGSLEGY